MPQETAPRARRFHDAVTVASHDVHWSSRFLSTSSQPSRPPTSAHFALGACGNHAHFTLLRVQ